MAARADSLLPCAICTLRARYLHIPRSFLLCLLSLWLVLSTAQALDPNKRLTQYAHTAWRIQDGFFPNAPYSISQTKDGYLWVGGNSGGLRFDGVRFTPWSAPIAATPVLPPFSVRAGDFWIATRSEIAHVRDNVVISHYDVPLNSMYKDSDGSIWTLSSQNPDRILCRATDAQIRCFGKTEGITIRMPFSFLPDGEGGFWIGGDTSLLHWKMGAAPEIYSPHNLQSNVGQIGIRSLLEDSDGSLLVGIMAVGPGLGLERFRNGVLTPVVLPNFDGSKVFVHGIMEDSDKNIWIATFGDGIYRIHDQTVDHFGQADGLSSNSVSNLYESDDGTVWAATTNGLDNFRDLAVTTFSTSTGSGPTGAASVMTTKDGTIWVANLGALDFIRNGAVSSVRVPGQQVSSLLEDRQSNIWVGVDDGLFVYKNGRFRRIPEPDHRPLGLVLDLTEDVDGDIWAECKGAQERRLIRIRDFEVREQFSQPQVPKAKAIAADPRGGIWLGAVTGELTFFREGIAHTSPLKLKRGSWAYQIAVDPDGSVITASDDGLVMLRAGKVQHLGKENGLPCDGVNGFVMDDDKNLWLGTPCGFIEIAGADVQRWWIHPDTVVQARLFDTLDGALPGRVSFNPAAKSPDGRLWFVNGTVLQMIDPSHLAGDGIVSPVYVESVVADRKQYKSQEGLQLPPLTRDLQINYTSPSFLIPQKVRFRYRLDGHDRDWQDAGTRREAFYTDLGPGKYRFRVIACNNNGVCSDAGAILDFAIAPAYYQTVWFRFLGLLLFLAVLTGLYRLRVRHLERQRDALRMSEKELQLLSGDLQESKAKLEEAQRITNVGYWERDLATDCITWSDETYRIFGLRPQEIPIDLSVLRQKVHPEDRKRVSQALDEALGGRARYDLEYRALRPTGELRVVHSTGDVKRDASGKPYRMFGTVQDITERKRAEEELQRSQFYLNEGQRLAHIGSWAYNPAGYFEYWSEELFQIYGLDPQNGAPTLEQYLATMHPQDRDSMADTIKKMHAEHSGCDVRKRIVRPDGQHRYVRCVGIPVVEGGVLKGFLGTAIDITEEELLTRELERRQAHLAEAQRLTHTGSWTINIHTDEHFWSEEIFRIYEFDPKLKPAGSLIRDRVHPDDRASLDGRREMEFTQTGWTDSEADLRIVLPDGRIKHLHTLAHPVIDASGQIVEIIGTTMDVTERKRIEDSLRRSESHLAEAQKLTHTGSWGWRTADRKPVHLSEEWYRIYGFNPSDGIPTWEAYFERVHPEDLPKLKGLIERAIAEKCDYEREFRILLPNGKLKWIHTVGHPVFSDSGDLEQFVGSSTDITAIRSAEQEHEKLRQLEADLAHINRVSMLGEMAASLAHEIKQPISAAITSANSCVEWLAHEPPNLDRARASAARIDKYGNRAAEIIDRMRSFYKKSPPQRELVDANGIVHEILTLLKGEATRSSVSMHTDLSAELPKIMADRVQLQQVFMNLMLNGIEAMQDSGGELTVKSELQHDKFQFSVSDTGPGLPSGNVDQIFSAFFTTKPQGSGMGLAISRSIVESHGGHLWASANTGGGATFHFTLPIQLTESSPPVA
jgi:PAS domain S-box-containing protein